MAASWYGKVSHGDKIGHSLNQNRPLASETGQYRTIDQEQKENKA
jgi:hypothetical protein